MVIQKYARILLSNFWHQLWFYDENRELTCHEKTLDDRNFPLKISQEFSPSPIPLLAFAKPQALLASGPNQKMELPPVESRHQSEVPKPNPAQRASNAESLGHLEGTESKGNFETAQSEAAV